MRNLLALGEQDVVLYRSHKSTLSDEEIVGFPSETDLKSALAHRPDAVIISNPTALHLEVAIPAAEAGCSILMEKPISHSMVRVKELSDALKRGGGKLLVGYQFRFHPGLQKIARLLREEAIGRPISARIEWGEFLPDWHPWEDYRKSYSARSDLGGGVALTLSHPLDYMRWLFGEVNSLWAFTGKISDLEMNVDDVAEAGFTFENGMLGSLHLDYYRRPAVHRMEIAGSQGMLRWDNADGIVHHYQSATNHWQMYPLPAGFERNDLFLAETSHFLDVVKGRTKPLCTLEDGVRALQLALAVQRSSRHSRRLHPELIYDIQD
jgi:predicted dehydrogenase